MTAVVRIPADPAAPAEIHPVDVTDGWPPGFVHDLLGGPIETLPLQLAADYYLLLINREAVSSNLPRNPRVSYLADEPVYGPVLLVHTGMLRGEPDVLPLADDDAARLVTALTLQQQQGATDAG